MVSRFSNMLYGKKRKLEMPEVKRKLSKFKIPIANGCNYLKTIHFLPKHDSGFNNQKSCFKAIIVNAH